MLAYAFALAMLVTPSALIPHLGHQAPWCVSSGDDADVAHLPQPSGHPQSETCCHLFCGSPALFAASQSALIAVLLGARFLRPLILGISGQRSFPPAAFSNPRAPPHVN